jgi:hypothetical protein
MPMLELDHLIVAGPDLVGLVAAFEDLTGARAAPGGRHAGQGTHNALVGLGGDRYLELLAPDPEQAGATSARASPTWRRRRCTAGVPGPERPPTSPRASRPPACRRGGCRWRASDPTG